MEKERMDGWMDGCKIAVNTDTETGLGVCLSCGEEMEI